MPCISDYQEPTAREQESVRVLTLLKEVGVKNKKFHHLYGDPQNLNYDTRLLCDWCKQNKDRISQCSLELQIWWRDHEIADKKRRVREEEKEREKTLRESALSKLTKEERKALGV